MDIETMLTFRHRRHLGHSGWSHLDSEKFSSTPLAAGQPAGELEWNSVRAGFIGSPED